MVGRIEPDSDLFEVDDSIFRFLEDVVVCLFDHDLSGLGHSSPDDLEELIVVDLLLVVLVEVVENDLNVVLGEVESRVVQRYKLIKNPKIEKNQLFQI